MLSALRSAGCRVLCYSPDVAGGRKPPLEDAAIAWAHGPVDLDAALPACDLVVCHAGESTVSQALLAGRPLLLMPQTAESFLTARRVREMGAGINIAELAGPLDWPAVVGGLLREEGYRRAAQAFAHRHADFDPGRQAASLAAVLEGLAARSS